MLEAFFKTSKENGKSSSGTSEFLIIRKISMKFRTEVPFFIQFPPSCHPEQREGSVTIHKNIFSRELHPNFFILRKSELPVQLKALFLSTLYRQKQEDGSNDSFSKTPSHLHQNPLAFHSKHQGIFLKRLHVFKKRLHLFGKRLDIFL